VLTVRYEDMRANPAATLLQILEFLDLGEPVDEEYVKQAVESTSLRNMHAILEQEKAALRGGPKSRQDGSKEKIKHVGQGLSNQSLAHLGTDIEEAYQKLLETDDDLAVCARQFGYAGV
jgi:hypothetical protein